MSGEGGKQQKKTKRKYWLVKIPNWVANQWFDDSKYVDNQVLAHLTFDQKKNKDPDIRVQLLPQQRGPAASSAAAAATQMNNNNSSSSSTSSRHPQIANISNNGLNGLNGLNGSNTISLSNIDLNEIMNESDLPIPLNFHLKKRESKSRVNVKHGELQTYAEDKLLVFTEEPKFCVNSEVEAVDTTEAGKKLILTNRKLASKSVFGEPQDSRASKAKNNSSNSSSNSNSKNGGKDGAQGEAVQNATNENIEQICAQIEASYNIGHITKVHANRTYDVRFVNHGEVRYNTPEMEIRLKHYEASKHKKLDKCGKVARTEGEFVLKPQINGEYTSYMTARTDVKKRIRKFSMLREKKNLEDKSIEERERDAQEEINRKRFEEMVSSGQGKKSKFLVPGGANLANGMDADDEDAEDSDGNPLSAKERRKRNNANKKRVRKEDDEYEALILKAFETRPTLTKKQIEKLTGEPWNFLKKVIQELCDMGDRVMGAQGWKLKPQYQLHNDKIGDITDDEDDDGSKPPPKKRQRR